MSSSHSFQKNPAAEAIRALAVRHGIVYQETGYDTLAEQITLLAGDDVRLDSIELLLVELERSGHIGEKKQHYFMPITSVMLNMPQAQVYEL